MNSRKNIDSNNYQNAVQLNSKAQIVVGNRKINRNLAIPQEMKEQEYSETNCAYMQKYNVLN